jgi:hypothetical protein
MRHPTFFEQEVRLVGPRWSPRVHELKRFLGHSGVRFRWFDPDVEGDLDSDTSTILAESAPPPPDWPLERRPYLLETRAPGVFVAGDVRTGSVKRLTVATGEGAMAIDEIHRYLSESFTGSAASRPGTVAEAMTATSASGRLT